MLFITAETYLLISSSLLKTASICLKKTKLSSSYFSQNLIFTHFHISPNQSRCRGKEHVSFSQREIVALAHCRRLATCCVRRTSWNVRVHGITRLYMYMRHTSHIVHVCVHVYRCVLYVCVVCLILCACLVSILLIKTRLSFIFSWCLSNTYTRAPTPSPTQWYPPLRSPKRPESISKERVVAVAVQPRPLHHSLHRLCTHSLRLPLLEKLSSLLRLTPHSTRGCLKSHLIAWSVSTQNQPITEDKAEGLECTNYLFQFESNRVRNVIF